MDVAEIEAFLVLCDELHFGRTAERLHVSQARVSRIIAGLESSLGGLLFERTSRRVALTPLGERLRDQIAPAYRQLTAAFEAARAEARSLAGPLRLGFVATTADPAIDRLITTFERANPGCGVTLHEVSLADSYTPLRTGEIDVLVCWLVLRNPTLAYGPALATYPRVLAVARDHPLAGEPDVSVEALGDHLVPRWEFEGLAAEIRRAMVPERTPSGRPVREHSTVVRSIGEVASLIARGQVVLPTVTTMERRFGNDGVVFVPIRDLPPVSLGLVWWAAHENTRIRALAAAGRGVLG